ncbi:GGDEF domain-containing protein [Salinicola socius]|uniref:GGDEF domain-containing protein n=1 Tax=Salinicola socius TaxID=404433 RepID=UPI000AC2958E|nr:sensor domain-containing diguanylate cyclase [Salinicola socius]
MVASKNPSSPQVVESPSTPDGLDTLNIAALIYRLEAGMPLLVDANETAKTRLQIGDRLPITDPWQWLDAQFCPVPRHDHPALMASASNASQQWQCFHIRQPLQPLQSLQLKVSALETADGADDTIHVLVAIGEITAVDDTPSLLSQTQPHLRQMLGNLAMGVCIIDAEGYLRLVNPAFCEFFGYAESELLNAHFRKLLPARHQPEAEKHHASGFPEALNQRRAVEVRLQDGSTRSVIIEDTVSHDEEGQPQRIAFLVDITERLDVERRLQEKNRRLEYLATRDHLTGLHNRRFGLEMLGQSLERSRRCGDKISVVMLDLDHFKAINDRYGHAVGDTILKEFSHFVAGVLRTSDTLIRWGGEEFLMILPGIDRFAAQTTVNRVLLQLVDRPLSAAGLRVSFSAGVGEHRQQTLEALLEEIDQALYQAKSAGRGCVAIVPVPTSRPEAQDDPTLSTL